MNRDQVVGMFLGVAIGDALGMPVETMTAEEIATKYGRITEYIEPKGHKWYDGWPAGRWTDDTQLTLAIAESLYQCQGINLEDMGMRQVLTMEQCSVGWGKSTKDSLLRLKKGGNRLDTGNPTGAGNGVAMKVAGLAAYLASRDVVEIKEHNKEVIEFTLMTHRTDIAVSSAFVQIHALLHCLIYGRDIHPHAFLDHVVRSSQSGVDLLKISNYAVLSMEQENVFNGLIWQVASLEALLQYFQNMSPAQIANCYNGAKCYVLESLPFSLAMFLRNPHSIEALYDTVNAGGDTDSNASMVAAMLGATNGVRIFPVTLVDKLWQAEKVLKVANSFCDCFKLD